MPLPLAGLGIIGDQNWPCKVLSKESVLKNSFLTIHTWSNAANHATQRDLACVKNPWGDRQSGAQLGGPLVGRGTPDTPRILNCYYFPVRLSTLKATLQIDHLEYVATMNF